MPNWKKILGPMPPKWFYVVASMISFASASAIALTVRTIAIPWQAIPLGCGLAVICGTSRWIRDETVGTIIDALVIEFTFAVGLHFYPTTLRNTWPADTQLVAVLLLPMFMAFPILEHFGILPKVRGHDAEEITTGAHKSLEAMKSSPIAIARRRKDHIIR